MDKVGDITFGAGFKMVDKEFAEVLNKITQSGMGMVLIGHEKVRVDTNGQQSIKHIVPDIPDRCAKILNRMVDLTAYIGMENGVRYIYPRQVTFAEGSQATEIYAGSHFANLNSKIDLSYDALVSAISEAMTSSASGKKVTLTDTIVAMPKEEKLNFVEIRNSIGKIAKALNTLGESQNDSHYMADYKKIAEQYLGKGRLVKDCDETQVEHLSLVLEDLTEYVKNNNIAI